jgi:hypothetical protein
MARERLGLVRTRCSINPSPSARGQHQAALVAGVDAQMIDGRSLFAEPWRSCGVRLGRRRARGQALLAVRPAG